MELKIKSLNWSAGLPIVMLNKKTAEKMGVHTGDRISIKNSKELNATLNIVENIVGKNQIGISKEVSEVMKLKHNQKIDINLAIMPQSLSFIKKKLDKHKLTENEINEIIKDLVSNALSEAEVALFISAMYQNEMTREELVHLIKAIVKNGNTLKLKGKYIVDKHCIGGIPGNITTPIVVSICAAAGLIFPKTSSRAITSAAGTADVIESVARVDFSMSELKKIISKTNACLAWGGGLNMVPADSKIIKIEKELKIDPRSQLLASVISKKIAVGSNYVLIDIPYGLNAKVSDKIHARKLQKEFNYLGDYFGLKIKCVLTKGNEPIGNGIGPTLELLDVLKVLDPKKKSPLDLEKKALYLATEILELSGKYKKGKAFILAQEILSSGKAFEKFKEIIKAQEGSLNEINFGKFKKDILNKKSGKIISIHNKKINYLARVAGCPIDKSAGLYLYHHVGKKLRKGDKILTIYSESKSRLNEAVKFYELTKPIKVK